MLKTDVSIRPADVCRLALFALLVALSVAAPAAAQIANPSSVEFTPSVDHSESVGGVAVVSSYMLRLYQVGASQPFHEMNIGKPAPASDGQIRFDLSSSISSWPVPGGTYEARVAAVGPGGEGLSDPSNTFTVSSCAVTLSGAGALFPAVGGGGSVGITTGAGCPWTVTATAPWVSVVTASGTGSGSSIISVAANPATVARTASVMVGALAYRIDQEAACAYSISSSGQTFPAAGGTASVAITAGSGCAWTATASSSAASWIVVSPSGGTGTASVGYQVAANTGGARTATLTIAGAPHTVSQAAASAPLPVPPPPPPAPSLPVPWQGQDVGTVGLAGTASHSSGVFTVSAAGADVSGSQDSFYFLSQALGAARTVTARITSLGTSAGARAGIMIRDGAAANAAHVSLLVRAGGTVEFVQRTSTGGATTVRGSTTQALPAWLRLVKRGAKVTASVSADGQTWTTLGTRNINSTRLQAGLAATSRDGAQRTTVTADGVAVR